METILVRMAGIDQFETALAAVLKGSLSAEAVQRIADARGVSMAQIGMAWVLNNPVVSAPIVGPTKPHHLADAVAALDITLTDEEIRSLEEPYVPRLPTYF